MRFIAILTGIVVPSLAHAQGIGQVLPQVECTGFYLFCEIAGRGAKVFGEEIAGRISTTIVEFLSLVTFIVVVWAAIQFIVGRGDLEKGKNTLYYAVGGYVAVRIALALVLFIVEFLNEL